MVPLMLGVASSMSIAAGGIVALRLQRHRALLVAFAAGTMLMIALLDLFPSAWRLMSGTLSLPLLVAMALFGIVVGSRFDEGGASGRWTPGWLFLHALIGGLAIGVGFHISWQTGVILAVASATHGLAHGANAVVLSDPANRPLSAKGWLIVNITAPVLGVLLSRGITVPPTLLALMLSFIAGAFVSVAVRHLPRRWSAQGAYQWQAVLVGAVAVIAFQWIMP
ncbi:hypothetical protein GCM10023219_14440 [Stakelama sediminis]|uniref:Zinc transporter ZupT n=1 Tax=Stakelama sediminis TaxID=463200 RepID=A0A840YX95_9SPHN|nr:hypothetical protein [Stakelama sediminis]MBB5718169.1 zinc transporter ZupT [Stakelama sediminis]